MTVRKDRSGLRAAACTGPSLGSSRTRRAWRRPFSMHGWYLSFASPAWIPPPHVPSLRWVFRQLQRRAHRPALLPHLLHVKVIPAAVEQARSAPGSGSAHRPSRAARESGRSAGRTSSRSSLILSPVRSAPRGLGQRAELAKQRKRIVGSRGGLGMVLHGRAAGPAGRRTPRTFRHSG